MRTQVQRRISLVAVIAWVLVGCATRTAQPTPKFSTSWTAIPLPSPKPTSTEVQSPTVAPSATEAPVTLQAMLQSRGLTLWQPEGGVETENPITPEILSNQATYGAFLDELDHQLDQAVADIRALEELGKSVIVEVHWNGVSSYADGTRVEIFYRDAENPETVLLIPTVEGGFLELEVGNLRALMGDFPIDAPFIWREPGRLKYLDNSKDDWATGLHVVDAVGKPVVIWDPELNYFAPWRKMSTYGHKLVNGLDKAFYGFSELELELLWEAFIWIEMGFDNPGEFFDSVVSARSTALPAWAAGMADRGSIRIDPAVFTLFRTLYNSPSQTDVLWIAGLLVHEATHYSQPGECTPGYAASQGMSLPEYALYLETGPGQAYEQEVLFLERLLELRDDGGELMINDATVRDLIIEHVEYRRGALGKATFPDGDPVPTCAGGG